MYLYYGCHQFGGTPQQYEEVFRLGPYGAGYHPTGRDESFVLVAQNNASDADLARAITVDDVIERVREGLTLMFEKKEAERSA